MVIVAIGARVVTMMVGVIVAIVGISENVVVVVGAYVVVEILVVVVVDVVRVGRRVSILACSDLSIKYCSCLVGCCVT